MMSKIKITLLILVASFVATGSAFAGKTTVNGWYEGEEIYYIDQGLEEGVTERGVNDIYLIGGNRAYQAQVVEFIPGEPGYSPHWNVNVVYTAEGVTLADILASPYASSNTILKPCSMMLKTSWMRKLPVW